MNRLNRRGFLRTGEKIRWDAAGERVTNSPRADSLLTRRCRDPWVLPGMEA